MIKLEHTETYGWEAAIRGMRNPLNSWDRSDSLFYGDVCMPHDINGMAHPDMASYELDKYRFDIRKNDYELAMKLVKAGPEHAKFRRMIMVSVDVTGPIYWYKELETYKVGTVSNSCSTMHKIHDKKFTLDDFSHEHLLDNLADKSAVSSVIVDENEPSSRKLYFTPLETLYLIIEMLNVYRTYYLEFKDKEDWWQMIQLLPSSYNQKRTIMLNYEVLSHIYHQRKDHKLDEWHTFCDWIKSLPYSEFITGEEKKELV